MRTCADKHVRLSTTSRDASVGLCRRIYYSKYKYLFESDETFVTEFRWQGCALWETGFRVCFVPNRITLRTFFRTFCFHLGIVCFCNPMTWSGVSREVAESSFDPFSNPISKKTQYWSQASKQTNCSLCTKLRSSVSVFFVRNSFESTIKDRPIRI